MLKRFTRIAFVLALSAFLLGCRSVEPGEPAQKVDREHSGDGGPCLLTGALWEVTDPGARLWIPADKLGDRQIPKQRGTSLRMYKGKLTEGYTFEKSASRKRLDKGARICFTPVTVVADVAICVAAVAFLIGLPWW